MGGGRIIAPSTFPFSLMAKHLYTFEKQKINFFNNIFQDIYIYIVITVNCTYQKSSASKFASATRALSPSHLSYFSASHFDFQWHFFEGSSSSSINSTSRMANYASDALSDTMKLRLWCPLFSS
jgi:hypothetical protein